MIPLGYKQAHWQAQASGAKLTDCAFLLAKLVRSYGRNSQQRDQFNLIDLPVLAHFVQI